MGKITDKIRKAGVVGAGGAGFPTHVKVSAQADIVLANGAECEPLLRVDQQVMQLCAPEIIRGLRLAMEETGAKQGVIALKSHYKQAVAALQKEIGGAGDIRLHQMDSYYPAGDEQQIVYEVTGKVVPTGGLPLDVGAVVCNVSTLKDIAAAQDGVPVTEKLVTVGGAVQKPCTLNVPVGTCAAELVAAAGGVTEDCRYIVGGPCMGEVKDNLDFPVTKTTGGLLAIPQDHPLLEMKDEKMSLRLIQAACCQCSFCTQLCPRNALGLDVAPHRAMRAVAQGLNLLENENGLFSCCDCGICTYHACNFGLKPHKIMAKMKAGLLAAGAKPRKERAGEPDDSFDLKKLPTARMILRMGLDKYDVAAPICGGLMEVKEVRIPLKMHVGAPAEPVVQVGDRVEKGDLIGEIPEGKLGARVHASMAGKVTEAGEFVVINNEQ